MLLLQELLCSILFFFRLKLRRLDDLCSHLCAELSEGNHAAGYMLLEILFLSCKTLCILLRNSNRLQKTVVSDQLFAALTAFAILQIINKKRTEQKLLHRNASWYGPFAVDGRPQVSLNQEI